jgi:large subunit ribosomal protein L4
MQVPVYNLTGETVRQIEVSDSLFGVEFNEALVHQAMQRQLANQRLGLADTKTRMEVAGSTKKPWAQKHTGRARRGSQKSPLIKGGGVVFGPHQRDYRQEMPKKMRRLAIRCVLSNKVTDNALRIVDKIEFAEAKTRQVAAVLAALKLEAPVLVATAGLDGEVLRAIRNLAGVKMLPITSLNVVDMLYHKTILTTEEGVRKAEALWAAPAKKAKE